MKFKVGEKVKFKKLTKEGKVPMSYRIDFDKVSHGQLIVGKEYYTKWAKIIDIIETDFYAVKYKDYEGSNVCLGFNEKEIERIGPITNWRGEFQK